MMGEKDSRCPVGEANFPKEALPFLTGRSLQRMPCLLGKAGDVLSLDLERQTVFLGQTAHECGILARLSTAQTVVEMRNHEILPSPADQEMKQGHGIATAGNSDDNGRSQSKGWKGTENVFQSRCGFSLKNCW